MIESVSLKTAERQGRWLPGHLPNKATCQIRKVTQPIPTMPTDSTTLSHRIATHALSVPGAGGWVQEMIPAICGSSSERESESERASATPSGVGCHCDAVEKKGRRAIELESKACHCWALGRLGVTAMLNHALNM